MVNWSLSVDHTVGINFVAIFKQIDATCHEIVPEAENSLMKLTVVWD